MTGVFLNPLYVKASRNSSIAMFAEIIIRTSGTISSQTGFCCGPTRMTLLQRKFNSKFALFKYFGLLQPVDAVLFVKDQPPADKFDLSLVSAIAQLPSQAEHVQPTSEKDTPDPSGNTPSSRVCRLSHKQCPGTTTRQVVSRIENGLLLTLLFPLIFPSVRMF